MLPFHIARYIMMSGTYVSGQFPDSFRIVGVHLEANGPWGRLWDHDPRAAQITKKNIISVYVQQKSPPESKNVNISLYVEQEYVPGG